MFKEHEQHYGKKINEVDGITAMIKMVEYKQGP
jgi:hypothetical protein